MHRSVECVGYQAHEPDGDEKPAEVLDSMVAVTRPGGRLGVVGVYVPQDPGATDDLAEQGRIGWDYGTFWSKGLSMGTGQCNTNAYNRRLRDLITHGRAKPSFIVSHELSLQQAA